IDGPCSAAFQTMDDFGNTLFVLDARDKGMDKKLKRILGVPLKTGDFISLLLDAEETDRTIAFRGGKKLVSVRGTPKKFGKVAFPATLTLTAPKASLTFTWKELTLTP